MMNEENITDLIPDYLDSKLNNDQRIIVETHIKKSKSLATEVEEYQLLFNAIEQEKVEAPSSKLKEGFLALLEEEKNNSVKVVAINQPTSKNNNNWLKSTMKIAASIAILAIAFASGRYFQSEKANLTIASIENESQQLKQTAMISLMENQSASKRIQGVQFIQDFKNPDEAIINALTDRMLHDENINVRLTAVEALSNFSSAELVKIAFIKALETEKDPSVQISLIRNLVKTQEKKALEPMKKLLEQEDTQPFVKDEINQVLSEII